jgi:hypothetical protein
MSDELVKQLRDWLGSVHTLKSRLASRSRTEFYVPGSVAPELLRRSEEMCDEVVEQVRDAADLIEQQAARLTALESERDALLAAAGKEAVTKLQVMYGPMPESNGKTNWTAILHKGDLAEGHTIDRSEYPDRVRYAADCVRYLIGELQDRPWILDYDADKHSGYVAPTAAQCTVPAGWKLVPVEPTPEMVLKGGVISLGKPLNERSVKTIYSAMLSVAPTAALEKGDGRDAWISVEERLPENDQIVAFVVKAEQESPNWHLNGHVLGGTYHENWGFSTPGVGHRASHWMPLPAAPAALSQKAGEQQ